MNFQQAQADFRKWTKGEIGDFKFDLMRPVDARDPRRMAATAGILIVVVLFAACVVVCFIVGSIGIAVRDFLRRTLSPWGKRIRGWWIEFKEKEGNEGNIS